MFGAHEGTVDDTTNELPPLKVALPASQDVKHPALVITIVELLLRVAVPLWNHGEATIKVDCPVRR